MKHYFVDAGWILSLNKGQVAENLQKRVLSLIVLFTVSLYFPLEDIYSDFIFMKKKR
jgi:hypothetical protein